MAVYIRPTETTIVLRDYCDTFGNGYATIHMHYCETAGIRYHLQRMQVTDAVWSTDYHHTMTTPARATKEFTRRWSVPVKVLWCDCATTWQARYDADYQAWLDAAQLRNAELDTW